MVMKFKINWFWAGIGKVFYVSLWKKQSFVLFLFFKKKETLLNYHSTIYTLTYNITFKDTI